MVSRIGDEPADTSIGRDEFDTYITGNKTGRNYLVRQQESGFKTELLFQIGDPKRHGVNGLTNEHLIKIVLHRIGLLDKELPSYENQRAVTHLNDALIALNARSFNRSNNLG